eukprot:TRINITY_DN48977_c0_g1_i1.p1 TRINITY_DN48977_c0_g1~~TRINITY_DN48977_c0_g1_i1.p1  ORF type:complete len:255 (-),score=78.50 TRINITY_DN48977_c0_g1_i1:133-831(-)
MPGRGKKTNHRARGREFSSAEAVQERNKQERPPPGEEREERPKQQVAEESGGGGGISVKKERCKKVNDSESDDDDMPRGGKEEPVELTRRQREEVEKEKARRRYEELHKAGKTDEAKADLARLEEVRKRREEDARKRQEKEEASKEAAAKKTDKSGMSAEVKEALGGEATRMRGDRSQAKKDADKQPARVKVQTADLYDMYKSTDDKPVEVTPSQPRDGSIAACRAEEDDFM